MSKKRVCSESTRRRNRVEPPTRPTDSTKSTRLTTVFFIIFVISSAVSIFVYCHYNHSSISSPYLSENNLVKSDVNYQEIIDENSRVSDNVTQRHFDKSVLAYITPWNSAGYEIAKRFSSKFTHISPVWYDLKSQGIKLTLEGRYNADTGWLSELRLRGNTRVLPRVVLEALPKDLFGKKKQRDKAIDLIVTECTDMDYDGVVLESWSRWAAYGVLNDAATRKLVILDLSKLPTLVLRICN
ncbi:hypothetical protein RND81_02G129900 [Saponaria officinalis]|uniref:Chitinase n=1 Tax=Saponaria officinalis TaxID=3572 RepID=A0AAW1MXV7_SAPOF